MKIGVWLDNSWHDQIGGGYSYYERLITGIDEYDFGPDLDICFVSEGDKPVGLKRKCLVLEDVYPNEFSVKERVLIKMPLLRGKIRRSIESRNNTHRKNCHIQKMRDAGIGFIFYPMQLTCAYPSFPFVATNWDVGHRSSFLFPELSNDDFEGRQCYYNDVLSRALLVCVESESGKRELLQYTHLNPERVKVVPLFAGGVADLSVDDKTQSSVLRQYGLEKDYYFYYPAQFWAHKNHYHLLLAFSKFLKYYHGYRLVFSGSDKGTLDYIKLIAESLGIADNVVFAGFVDTVTVYVFYKGASAMVMPTFLGPTNMPLLEAMELGCPVICSDLSGHREELGDAALYVSPLDDESICNAMVQMVSQNNEFREKIKKRQSESVFNLSNALKSLNVLFETASQIRACWGD